MSPSTISSVNDQFSAALAAETFLLCDAAQVEENISRLRNQTLSLFSSDPE